MTTPALSFLIESSLFLQVTRTSITSGTSSKLGQIRPRTEELAAPERLEKSPETLAHSFLIESFSFLQITRIYIKAWMSSKFGQILPPTLEFSALVCLKN